jgi:hypothetical protein
VLDKAQECNCKTHITGPEMLFLKRNVKTPQPCCAQPQTSNQNNFMITQKKNTGSALSQKYQPRRRHKTNLTKPIAKPETPLLKLGTATGVSRLVTVPSPSCAGKTTS